MSKERKIVVSNIEAKQAKTTFSMDAEGRFSADGLFHPEGASADDFTVATFARAFESAFLKKYGDEPTLPEAAAQRPDIDTITPTLT